MIGPVGRRRSRALAAALVALVGSTATIARAADPNEGETIALDDHVSVTVPADMTRESRSLGPRGDMLTLADGSDVMVLVVYRRGVADKPPSAGEALKIHADELEHALGPATRKNVKQRALGRDHNAIALTTLSAGVEREAWVVAFETLGRTIVASAVAVRGSPNEAAMLAILKGIRVR